jgi:hypothetical protein
VNLVGQFVLQLACLWKLILIFAFYSVGFEDGVLRYRTEKVYRKNAVESLKCLKCTTNSPTNLNVHDDASTNSEGILVVVNKVKGYRWIQGNSTVQWRLVGRFYIMAGDRMIMQLMIGPNGVLHSVQQLNHLCVAYVKVKHTHYRPCRPRGV